MTAKLPLFPLNTVLYPSAPIALHIFEERYRLMIGRCLEQSSSFGIVLIRSGQEVDPNDAFFRELHERTGTPEAEPPTSQTIPYSMGTAVRINECHRFEDGRYYLTAVGVRRFRVQYLAQQQPYLIASVAYIPDQTTPELPALAEQVRDLYTRYWQAVTIATGQQYQYETLPADPLELSYILAHQLRVDLSRKQRWLEADAMLRLRELGAALRSELALIPGARPGDAGPWTWN
jgi:uncharacterized protein